MPRNDAILYSGLATYEELRKERIAEKQRKAKVLLPVEQVLFDEIDRERKGISKQLITFIEADTEPENLKSVLLALKMYDSYLIGLKNRLTNIVRQAKKQQGAD